MDRKFIFKRCITGVLILSIVFVIILIAVINIYHINYNMNADIAAEGLLARLISDTGEWIPKSWYRSSEARIIATANIMSLFYGITKNLGLSMGLGCLTMTILICCSLFYVAGVFKIKINQKLLLILMALVFPASTNIAELLYIFAGYYGVHTVVLFITLRFFVEFSRNEMRSKYFKIILSFMLAFALGLQGTRGILIIYGPLFTVSLLRVLYSKYSKSIFQKYELNTLAWCFVQVILSYVGTRFPFSVGQSFSRNIRAGFSKLLFVVIPDMAEAIGMGSLNTFGKICTLLLTGISIFCLIRILINLFKKKEIENIEWIYLVLYASPLMTAFMVAFTTIDSSPRYYYLLLFVYAVSILLAGRGWKAVKVISVLCFFVIGLNNLTHTYLPIILHDRTNQSDAYHIAEYLMENDYKTAYTTFDYANMITLLANGKVGVYAIDTFEKMNVCKWLTSTLWYPPNKPVNEKTAYIVAEARAEEMNHFMEEHPGEMKEIAEIGKYVIYESLYNYTELD